MNHCSQVYSQCGKSMKQAQGCVKKFVDLKMEDAPKIDLKGLEIQANQCFLKLVVVFSKFTIVLVGNAL